MSNSPTPREDSHKRLHDLGEQVKALKQDRRINTTLLEISNAVNTTPRLDDLYADIHRALNRLIPVPNLFISIYDRENQSLHFPYYKDEIDKGGQDTIVMFKKNSLTGEVILSQKPLFLDEAMLKDRKDQNSIQGSIPVIWMGVPLITQDRVIGVIAVQSYTDAHAYTEKDLELLTRISTPIASAIDRKQLQEGIRESEHRHACFDRINSIIISTNDMEDMLNRVLDAMLDIFDCDRAWLIYPCNPDVPFYEMPFLSSKPDWHIEPGHRVKIDQEARDILREIVQSQSPLVFGPRSERGVRPYVRDKYHVKSMMAMALFPKTGEPWEVVLHQCSHPRKWSPESQKLFQGICQRIGDGLESMLLYRQLGQAKKYIGDILDSMPSILMGVDGQGRLTHWNRQAGLSTGVAADKAIGRFFYDVFPELLHLTESIKKAVTRKKVVELPRQKHGKGHDIMIWQITVFPLEGQGNQEAVVRIDDVTEKVRVDQMMVQSEKMLSVGGLAAGMAHEINNPLAGMMQNAQVIKNRLTSKIPANLDAAQKIGISLEQLSLYLKERRILDKFDHIGQAGRRAADIVSNMLSFSKKSEGRQAYENLDELMERTVALARNEYTLKRKFSAKNIRVKLEVQKDFPPVLCQGVKIQQVFLNILKNGMEAMLGNSRPPDDEWFLIHFFVKDGMAVVKISDKGPGMDPHVQTKIFDPFFTTKSPGEGTGLGLSVSYFIVTEDHKGEMGVSSTPGKGTVFRISLPIHG